MSLLFNPFKVIRNMIFPATLPSYVILENTPEENWTVEKRPPESALLNMLDALPENLSIAVQNLLAAHGLPENLDPFIKVGEELEKLMLQLERLWVSHCPFPTSTFHGSKTESMLLVDHWLLYLALFRIVREKFPQNLHQTDNLPLHWNDMAGHLVKVYRLNPEFQEYKDLTYWLRKRGFSQRLITIKRVQNKTLWKSYQLKKKELEQKNHHRRNELILFHGTRNNSIANINSRGFNRSYTGLQGAKYGKGSYFVTNPNYWSKFYMLHRGGNKHMYIARVLVGNYTQGREELIDPPAMSPDQTGDLFDSVVDHMDRPTVFITFNDIQAYPEYLISFM